MTAAFDVRRAFDAGARRYDLLVALNPGYHRSLRAAAAKVVGALPHLADRRSPRILDLGCGSGASTRALLTYLQHSSPVIVGVDASAGMLDQARRKPWPEGVSFAQARAQELDSLGEEPFDGALLAYLLRNVPSEERGDVLESVWHRLCPGGTVVLHEYSVAGRPSAIVVWTLVCWLVVIPLSIITGSRPSLYTYLWRSVLEFDSTARLAQRLSQAGFVDVQTYETSGWSQGILHTVTASKPPSSMGTARRTAEDQVS